MADDADTFANLFLGGAGAAPSVCLLFQDFFLLFSRGKLTEVTSYFFAGSSLHD